MDAFDRKILAILQRDSSLSVAEVAEQVGLSTTPCWRRIRNLQESGVIEREAAILNPDRPVILPEPLAGCPMAEMITPAELVDLKKTYPDHLVMCYVNSTAEIKALSDVCCTSSNALKITWKLPENNGGFNAIKFAKTHPAVYDQLTTDHPIDLCRYQVANCYMGKIGLINSGGASGDNDLQDAITTAVINKRARNGIDFRAQGIPKTDERGRQTSQRDPGCLSFQRRYHCLAVKAQKGTILTRIVPFFVDFLCFLCKINTSAVQEIRIIR